MKVVENMRQMTKNTTKMESSVCVKSYPTCDEVSNLIKTPTIANDSKNGKNTLSISDETIAVPCTNLWCQWVYFIGFYTKAIIKDFVRSAASHKLTGFLMPGKPAIAGLEGTEEDITAFLKHVRTVVFAMVPPGMRKMNLPFKEDIKSRRFPSFEERPFMSQPRSHKRSDMADMSKLRAFVAAHGVPDSIFKMLSME